MSILLTIAVVIVGTTALYGFWRAIRDHDPDNGLETRVNIQSVAIDIVFLWLLLHLLLGHGGGA